jgi:hypothetical protein
MRTPSALSANITASPSREAAATLTAATDPPLDHRARLKRPLTRLVAL